MASVADFSKLKVIFIAVAIVIAGWLLNFLIALYRARMSVKGLVSYEKLPIEIKREVVD